MPPLDEEARTDEGGEQPLLSRWFQTLARHYDQRDGTPRATTPAESAAFVAARHLTSHYSHPELAPARPLAEITSRAFQTPANSTLDVTDEFPRDDAGLPCLDHARLAAMKDVTQRLARQSTLRIASTAAQRGDCLAEVIARFMALGYRVLVTSGREESLDRIWRALPESLRTLCARQSTIVGVAERPPQQALSAMRGIALDDLNTRRRHLDALLAHCAHSHEKLVAEIETQWTQGRAFESEVHSVDDGRYQGVLREIIWRLAREAPREDWFDRELQRLGVLPPKPPLSANELRQWAATQLPPDGLADVAATAALPNITELPPPEKYRETVAARAEWRARCDALRQRADHQVLVDLTRVTLSAAMRESLENAIREFQRDRSARIADSPAWVVQAIRDSLAGNDQVWNPWVTYLRSRVTESPGSTEDVLARIQIDGAPLKPAAIDPLRKQLNEYRTFLTGPPRRKLSIFSPTKWKQFSKSLRYNGQPCDSIDTVVAVFEALDSWRDPASDEPSWPPHAPPRPPLKLEQISHFRRWLDEWEDVEAVQGLRDRLLETFREPGIPSAAKVDWGDDEAIKRVLDALAVGRIEAELARFAKQGEAWRNSPALREAEKAGHPVTRELVQALQEWNADSYAQAIDRIKFLVARRLNEQQSHKLEDQLRVVPPRLLEHLRRNAAWLADSGKAERLLSAWQWARAKAWCEEILATKSNPPDLAAYDRLQRSRREAAGRCLAGATIEYWLLRWATVDEAESANVPAAPPRDPAADTADAGDALRTTTDLHDDWRADYLRNVPVAFAPLASAIEWSGNDPGAFDVVVVDEAESCGLEAAPLLTARYALVTAVDLAGGAGRSPALNAGAWLSFPFQGESGATSRLWSRTNFSEFVATASDILTLSSERRERLVEYESRRVDSDQLWPDADSIAKRRGNGSASVPPLWRSWLEVDVHAHLAARGHNVQPPRWDPDTPALHWPCLSCEGATGILVRCVDGQADDTGQDDHWLAERAQEGWIVWRVLASEFYYTYFFAPRRVLDAFYARLEDAGIRPVAPTGSSRGGLVEPRNHELSNDPRASRAPIPS